MSLIDWDNEMAQSFSYYEVSPATWQVVRKIPEIVSAELTFDADDALWASATFEARQDVGESVIRAVMTARQGREEHTAVLGTFLAQTVSRTRGSTGPAWSVDAYSPLLELADDSPPLGYYVPKGANVLASVCDLAVEHCRAPVVRAEGTAVLAEAFVAAPEETWLDLIEGLAARASRTLGVDPMGRIVLMPARASSAMRPVCALGASGHRIMRPDVTDERDLFGVPTSVQLVWSGPDGVSLSATAHNDNPDSSTSREARGRTILLRETDVDLPETMSLGDAGLALSRMASDRLAEEGCLEHSVSYERGYLPNVGVGSCVYIEDEALGVASRAVVSKQTISCQTGCKVAETAKYTEVA